MTRGSKRRSRRERDEGDSDRLRKAGTPEAMSIALVAAVANGQAVTAADRDFIRRHKTRRGPLFYSDLLYAISHHYFAPETAEAVWDDILAHKQRISAQLGRDVQIVVAALDYLSNVTSLLTAPTLISEPYLAELASLAMRDGMTGLFNHTACYELLELELRNRRRHGVGVSVVLLDIDDFKSVNDSKGHQGGDRVVVSLARALVEAARDSDVCCRFGGDEFVLILRLTNDPREACAVAERVREHIAGAIIDGQQIAVSAGVAVASDATTSSRALMERADRALYSAKTNGKNRVVLARHDVEFGGLASRSMPRLAGSVRAPEPARDHFPLSSWEGEGGSLPDG